MFNALSSKVAFDNLEDCLTGSLAPYPSFADAKVLTGHANAWTPGAYAEVVPVSTITGDFFIEAVVIEAVSAADFFQVAIATGLAAAEVNIAAVRFSPGHVTNSLPIVIPIRKKVPANTRISALVANKAAASAKTASISILYRLVA